MRECVACACNLVMTAWDMLELTKCVSIGNCVSIMPDATVLESISIPAELE